MALNYVDGQDLTVFTAAFQKVGDLWKFRGARETVHATLARGK
jgi:hypothetical protein